ncbi:APC amino acid permease [Laetiporus sulphureus 93-53]|uniref:APC amino acid permease n=1 Tax=Laetiporus sulphureus 93-53 TaxID=1314785 RepID=A0A165CQT6_9APHY|nr:APC amino acid permease [Laetiporus sulphureus 93-53]KZT03254.1 APC amino acid permease [Laetiporus sulphureus 93-53]
MSPPAAARSSATAFADAHAAPKIQKTDVDARSVASTHLGSSDDDERLIEIGYVPSFKREFSNLATISFAFSIMGLCSSVATTFNTPLLTGGPASVTWCWILGACMCFTLGSSIAEIVSAFPTCGGLYTASAQLCPPRYRPIVGWIVGWLNLLGQVVGLSSTEFGLANMIWAAVVIGKDGNFVVTQGMTVGLFAGLMVFNGLLNCVGTRYLAHATKGFVFVNLGATFLIIIVLLAKTPRSEMHPASYVFGSFGIVNQTGGWNDGLAFLFGLLSVQWTMTDYDATAHISYVWTSFLGSSFIVLTTSASAVPNPLFALLILRNGSASSLLRRVTPMPLLFGCIQRSVPDPLRLVICTKLTAHYREEVRRAAYAAPSAIFIAVIGTGLIGWILNIVVVLCSGPLENLPGASGSAFLEIMALRIGKPGALFLWSFVCLTAFFVCQTALQACSRTVYAFSRDHGLPDGGYFGQITPWTKTPLRAVWLTTIVSILPGLLDLASTVAANAIFASCAIALDSSYIIPIILRRVFRNHPEVHFTPGPFYMGDGMLGWTANTLCVLWTLFVCVIFSMPTVLPVTKTNMNYASVIVVGVIALSSVWYICGAHRHYKGPSFNARKNDQTSQSSLSDDMLTGEFAEKEAIIA